MGPETPPVEKNEHGGVLVAIRPCVEASDGKDDFSNLTATLTLPAEEST